MPHAARLIGAGVGVAAALVGLTTLRTGVVDVGAGVLLVASLLGFAHVVFRLVDDPHRER